MPHLSPLYRFFDGFVCGFRFWPNCFSVFRFCMIFFFGFAVSNTPQCPPQYFISFFNGMSKGQVDVMHNRASSVDQVARVTRYKYFFAKCSRIIKYPHRRQEHHSKSLFYAKSRFNIYRQKLTTKKSDVSATNWRHCQGKLN